MDRPASGIAMRTLRLKVKAESYPWLAAAALEVNQVFNWANATSIDAADRNRRAKARFLSGFELCRLSAGATECVRGNGSSPKGASRVRHRVDARPG
jgi:hypothetical protein